MNLSPNDKVVIKSGFWKGKTFKVMNSTFFGLMIVCSNGDTMEKDDVFYCNWFWKWQLELLRGEPDGD